MARTMLARAFAAGIPACWVTMDEAYGQSKSLRVWMEKHDQAHVVTTRRNDDVVTTSMGFACVDKLIAALPGRAWSRISAGPGAHGPREYHWARVPVRVLWRPGAGTGNSVEFVAAHAAGQDPHGHYDGCAPERFMLGR